MENQAGDLIIAPDSLTTQRVYTTDLNNVSAKNQEEQLQYDEMYQQLAQQLLLRLRALAPQQPAS